MCCRSYLYAADLAIWLWTILFQGKACRPYNVGSDQEITIADLAETVASVLGAPLSSTTPSSSTSQPVHTLPPPSRYVPSIDRARNELGLSTRTQLQEAVQKTMDYLSWFE
jgi:dTDP-glucose 4,6-dehydratase